MLELKLQKCIIAFDHKKTMVAEEINKFGPLENLDKKKERIEKQLINPGEIS